MAVIDNHGMSLTKKRIILSCFRKWKPRERIKQLARIDKYGKLRTRKKEKRKKPEVVRESPTESKLRANGCNNSHYCWPNNVGRCCVRLHLAKSLTGFKLWTTTPNNMQQGVQMEATCIIQQSWELLANIDASVCTGLKRRVLTLLNREL